MTEKAADPDAFAPASEALRSIEALPVDHRSAAYLARYQQLLDRLDAPQ